MELEQSYKENFTSIAFMSTEESDARMQSNILSHVLEGCHDSCTQEEKKSKKKTGKINMDGQAKILHKNDIVSGVKEWQDVKDKVLRRLWWRKKAKEKYMQPWNRKI